MPEAILPLLGGDSHGVGGVWGSYGLLRKRSASPLLQGRRQEGTVTFWLLAFSQLPRPKIWGGVT